MKWNTRMTDLLNIGFINKVFTAKELIDNIINGAEKILTEKGIGGFRFTA